MKLANRIAYALTGHRKYMEEFSDNELYEALNRELYRWIFRGSPHTISDNIENYITQAYTYNSLVYSIINYMATTASSVGWKLEERKGDKVNEIYDHEFLDLWKMPNKDQTCSEFIEAQLIYKYATGNSYIYAPRLGGGLNNGKLVKMEVMPSHQTTPIFGDYMEPVRGYVLMGNDFDREIAVEDVMHIKYLNPDVQNQSPAIGMSPLKALLTVITQNNDAWRSLASAFQNGGPAGFFSREGSNLEGEFTKEQGEKLIERLRRENTGPSRTNTLAAVGGNVKYTQVGLSPVDLNILESIRVSFVQVCNAFKFPASLLNFDAALTYNNFTEAQKILWTTALKQDLEIIGQKVSALYLPAYGENLTLCPDYSSIEVLQSNKREMVEWLNMAWWIKANRKQELMGEDVDPELDKYFIPAGLMEKNFDEEEDPSYESVEETLRRLEGRMNGNGEGEVPPQFQNQEGNQEEDDV